MNTLREKPKTLALLGLLALSVFALMLALSSHQKTTTDNSQKEKILQAYAKLPLYFIPNQGQIDERVKL